MEKRISSSADAFKFTLSWVLKCLFYLGFVFFVYGGVSSFFREVLHYGKPIALIGGTMVCLFGPAFSMDGGEQSLRVRQLTRRMRWLSLLCFLVGVLYAFFVSIMRAVGIDEMDVINKYFIILMVLYLFSACCLLSSICMRAYAVKREEKDKEKVKKDSDLVFYSSWFWGGLVLVLYGAIAYSFPALITSAGAAMSFGGCISGVGMKIIDDVELEEIGLRIHRPNRRIIMSTILYALSGILMWFHPEGAFVEDAGFSLPVSTVNLWILGCTIATLWLLYGLWTRERELKKMNNKK